MSSSESSSPNTAIKALNVLNLVAFIANIGFVNGVPALFDLPDNAEVSNKYQTLVTPAGWAFAIWGLIFLVQAIWAIVQVALPPLRTNPLVTKGVAYNYIAVCAFQVAWTFAFGLQQITMSLIWMVGILIFLGRIYVEQQKVSQQYDRSSSVINKNYWLLRFPFGLHFGWIIAATLVNANVVLVAYNAPSSLMFSAAIGTVAIASLVAAAVLIQEFQKTSHPDVVIPLVLTWALNAISKELNNPKSSIGSAFSGEEISVIKNGSETAAIAIFLSAVVVVVAAWWKRRNEGSEGRSEEESLLNQQQQ